MKLMRVGKYHILTETNTRKVLKFYEEYGYRGDIEDLYAMVQVYYEITTEDADILTLGSGETVMISPPLFNLTGTQVIGNYTFELPQIPLFRDEVGNVYYEHPNP